MLVSIIIVNWNGREYLQECLPALCKQTYASCEIIFVDNGSTDGSINYVRDFFPAIKIVKLPKNKGFAGGNIEGLKVARGEFIALLNNDTCVEENWLERLVNPMLSCPDIGICASKLIAVPTGQIDSAGDLLTPWAVGVKRGIGSNPENYERTEYVFGACAAAALYRRDMIEDIGFFDEDFFFNDEDTDLNFRALLRGWKCFYVPDAVVYHRVNATIGRLSDLHVYFHARNLEYLWIKNMPFELMLRYFPYKVFQEIGSFLYLCVRHGKWRPFLQGKLHALQMVPAMLKKRQKIQRQKSVTSQYVKSFFTPIFEKRFLHQKFQQFIQG